MRAPFFPDDEACRLATLDALALLDTPPDERFDRLTRLSRRVFGAPISLVSLVDAKRQWFKSCHGLALRQTPREISFCGHAILGDETLVVPDARLDERFRDNPLVLSEPRIRFYAGHPLRASNGHRLGTLCVMDHRPRRFDDEDRQLLQDLAHLAEREIAAIDSATTDELTLLSSRRGFDTLAAHALAACRRRNGLATMLLFDLDGLSQVNARFGTAEGDRALRSFAQLLLKTFRESDIIGRIGGDKFVVLATDTAQHTSSRVLNRLLEAVHQHNAGHGAAQRLRYSVGALEFVPDHDLRLDEILAQAEAAMLESKMRKRAIAIGAPQPVTC